MTPKKKTIIVAGNCQAQNVAEIFRRNADVADRYRILYPAGIPGLAGNDVTEEDAASCDLVFQQVGYGGKDVEFSHYDKLNPAAHIIRFPGLMLLFLYPFFTSRNPYNIVRPPALPWGLFPYPDSAILNFLEQDIAGPEILDIYLNHYERYAVDFERIDRLEHARSVAFDRSCDVSMTDFMFTHFRDQRLFFTTLHPTPLVYRELSERIAAACRAFDPVIADSKIGETQTMILRTHPRGALYSQMIPVHPKVHEQYDLAWYDPNERFELHTTLATYTLYFATMIAEFGRVRAEQRAAGSVAG